MDAGRWERVKAVFQEAFEKSAPEQGTFLDAACRDDSELRSAVERLLEASARAGPLDNPPAPTTDPDDAALADAREPDTGGRLPSRIGAYRILRELGRGGMGVVYLAERDEPGLRKSVAVKVLRPGRDSAFVVRRFRREMQILAALEHPGIARLYDGGTTDEGLPFFIMEYVDGEELRSYCDARRLPLRARLELFLRICEAVQFAHRHLVVHRDLKPSNVLVTLAGDPKLLDFGIAKLLGPRLAEDGAEETAAFMRLMTPDYASPEQVRGERITTATDVYSLAVILYELLSGQRPYRLDGRAAVELERAFERDPEPPSLAVASAVTASGRGGGTRDLTPERVSALRQTTPRALRRLIRGDLDRIVLKALSRDPAHRYATAAELGEDVRRHLEGLPVRARPDRAAYRVGKFVRRHRTAVTAAAAISLSLVTGLAIALRQARVADTERRRAEARFQDVRRLANSVIYELHDAIANLPGATPARQLLVTRALEYLDRLAGEARDDAALQRELADAYQRVAQVQGGGLGANLGDTQSALLSYRKALAIRESLAVRPAAAEDVLGLAVLEFDLGALLRAQGLAAEAERSFLSAAARLVQLRGRGALPDAQRRRLGAVYQRLAEAQTFQGKLDAALSSAQRAQAEAELAFRERPAEPAVVATLAAASQQLASALAAKDRHAEALARVRQARALLEAALRDNPLDAQHTRVLLYALYGEGEYLLRLNRREESLRVREHALDVAEDARRRDPRDRWSQMGVAIAARALGEVLLENGDAHESAQRFRLALRIAAGAAAADPHYRFARLEAASAEHGLGRALLSQSTRDAVSEGCAALQKVRQFWGGLQSSGELPPGEVKDLTELPRWLSRCASAP